RPGGADGVVARGRGVRLETLHPSQSRGQLHRLLPERTFQRRRATLWPHRPAREQTRARAPGGSGLALPALAAAVARAREVSAPIETRRFLEKENGRGP